MSRTKSNPIEYEFGGPFGALSTMVSLPIVIYFLYFLCTGSDNCFSIFPFDFPSFPDFSNIEFWNTNAFLSCILWIVWLIVLQFILPGKIVKGVKLEDGTQLEYKINGFLSFILSIIVIITCQYFHIINLGFIYNHYISYITSSVLISLLLSIYLYINSFNNGGNRNKNKILAQGGNTGNFIYDFFIGRELNPRIFSFDLKVFCELKPGLIGWIIIDYSMAIHQYELYGNISNGMILVCLFQTIYVADALWFEQSILTTMDVTTDGFGYMLAFGDLAWVPFTYSLQARYLATIDFFQWDIIIVIN